MPFGPSGSRPFPFDYRKTLNKVFILVGILIIVYAVLWILAELKLIPLIVYALFPQFVLLLVGIFIFYQAYSRRNLY
ncbi:hypothetical protein [Methanobrevibacter olleyae]|uniref:Uncharacterized protein n=1 Tax=Methanobrevibacter olleyae TaxID=294671 RepID=A0A126QZ36_METOL|nr:hypothetical protein [Methanobrevibacter olleyae]AMK15074.1 hypothetical protein YLM1_0517 [Methanobrevibacter olleyae]SFL39548.1 hypothetical protein SAMN02910297_00766 [Methanobrevibacter olleyae]